MAMIKSFIDEKTPDTLLPFTEFMENNSLTLEVITMLNGSFCCRIKNTHITQGDASVVTIGMGSTKGEALHKLVLAIIGIVKLINGIGLKHH